MVDKVTLAKALTAINKAKAQNFGPKDSQIISALMHPVEAINRVGEWFRHNVSQAMGGDPYDNPNPLFGASRDEQVEAAFNLAGIAQLGSMPGAPSSAGGTLGTFIGPKSANWNKEKAALAEKLLAGGAKPEQVWKDHMIGKMPSGHLFSEIPDNKAFYRGVMNGSDTGYADEVFLHPELYDNYKSNGTGFNDLGATKVREVIGANTGTFNPNKDRIDVGINGGGSSTMIHELQHSIQQREGWPQGGSPINNGPIAMDVYNRLTGEAQARASQNRMNMTMDERRANYPMAGDKLDDVPLNRLIDHYGSGEQRSISQLPETEFSLAHKLAQEHAALPVEQGGLGLPPNNTATDRARALGFDTDTDLYHGTKRQFDEFNNKPTFFTKDKDTAERFGEPGEYRVNLGNNSFDINYGNLTDKQRNYFNELEGKLFDDDDINDFSRDYEGLSDSMEWGNLYKDAGRGAQDKVISAIKKDGYSALNFPDFHGEGGDKVTVVFDQKNIRSKFAAFDPFKKDSANILASALAGTTLASQLKDNDK